MWSPWTLETKIIAKLKAEIKALRQYPNVMAFFGHYHRNCADELNLWQGEYTVVHVPSTSYCCTRGGGRENSFTIRPPTRSASMVSRFRP